MKFEKGQVEENVNIKKIKLWLILSTISAWMSHSF